MLVIPAIDLKDGRCVRLRQGDLEQETVYSQDPAAMATHWEDQGARLIHVVDLNGAVEGRPKNAAQVRSILHAVSVPIQVGGGIRSLEVVKEYLDLGVRRVVLGTSALRDPFLLSKACAEFPSRIVVGIDAKQGRVALHGWTTVSETSPTELVKSLAQYALAGIIYTDIARDGMLEGPNLDGLKAVLSCAAVPLIASGGITRVEDLVSIDRLGPGIEGAIVGKALYEGRFTLREGSAAVGAFE